jgi:hypothetical protein
MPGAEAEIIVRYGAVKDARKELDSLNGSMDKLGKTKVSNVGTKETAAGFKQVGDEAEKATGKAKRGLTDMMTGAWYTEHAVRSLGRSFMHIAGPIGGIMAIQHAFAAAAQAQEKQKETLGKIGEATRGATISKLAPSLGALTHEFAGRLKPEQVAETLRAHPFAGAPEVRQMLEAQAVGLPAEATARQTEEVGARQREMWKTDVTFRRSERERYAQNLEARQEQLKALMYTETGKRVPLSRELQMEYEENKEMLKHPELIGPVGHGLLGAGPEEHRQSLHHGEAQPLLPPGGAPTDVRIVGNISPPAAAPPAQPVAPGSTH